MIAVADTQVADLVRHARALVFDFDGTLVDSNPIKRRAFELCFKEFPEHRGKILEYCWSNNHVSRAEKFRHVYEKILDLPYTKQLAAMLHERFERATTRQIVEAPEIPGAEKFLQTVAGSHILTMLSSTPHEILLDILAGRGWRGYFGTIQGTPVAKGSWLIEFQRTRRLRPQEILFFGDTLEDADAVQEAGCGFIAVGGQTWNANGALSIADFTELLGL